MKRLLILILLCCLVLWGCGNNDTPSTEAATQPTTEPASQTQPTTKPTAQTQPPTEATTEPTTATQAPTEAPTEPTQPKPQKVTVYLLTKVTHFDSASIEYHYDANHNIDSYQSFTIENTPMYETFFQEKDANGMACVVRTLWAGNTGEQCRNLTYSADGKLQQEQFTDSNYSGFQYTYDQAGNQTEKREYYEGLLEAVTYFTYDSGKLTAAYGEDNAGNKLFECRVENGLIVEKIFLDSDEKYSYRYTYDEHNNLIQTTFYSGGEDTPGDQYFYQAVEVDPERAPYLLAQQRYLIAIP